MYVASNSERKKVRFDKDTSVLALARESAPGRRSQKKATRDEWDRYEWLGEEQIEPEQLFGISGRTRTGGWRR